MDEVTGVRLCPVADSGHWEVHLRFASGRISVVRFSSLGGAVASAALFRRRPTLTVIDGGRTDAAQVAQSCGGRLTVITGSQAV
jgi:hypothetical protein